MSLGRWSIVPAFYSNISAGDCMSVSRRDLLKLAAAGGGSLLLPGQSLAQAVASGKAKAVIQIWQWGGPPHTDTFDPKPGTGRDFAGQFDEADLPTNVDGLHINPLLQNLAKCAEKYSVIRGMTHGNNNHETAAYMVQTGHSEGDGESHPAYGAVTALTKGWDCGYKGLIPPYVALTAPLGRFSEAGFLGSRCKVYATGGNPNAPTFAADGIASEGLSRERQLKRRDLLAKLDVFRAEHPELAPVTKLSAAEEHAYELILGDAGKVFDLNLEKPELRDKYGRTTFGQSCLAARRLVESGVVFVTINYGGWDTHKNHFPTMNTKLPELDNGLATLLTDLDERGLLDQTIVVCGGEFGRTPKVDYGPTWGTGGRHHYGKAFSYLLAGGGFKGGRIVGKTDERGETVVERPVYPCDLIGSIYRQLGIPRELLLPHPQQKKIAAYPEPAAPEKTGGLLDELV